MPKRISRIAALAFFLLITGCQRGTNPQAETAFRFVQGRYAYVPHGQQILVMDIGQPDAPQPVAAWDAPGPVEKVVVSGRYAYVVHRPSVNSWVSADGPPDGGVQIVDISDPHQPQPRGYYRTPDLAEDVALVGDVAYVADWSGLRVVDVSHPDAPTLATSIPQGISAVQVVGNRLYASWGGCSVRGYCSGGLWVADVTTPTEPMELGVYSTDNLPGYDVAVTGHYAYVAGKGAWVADIADPTHPAAAARYDLLEGAFRAEVEATETHLFLAGANLHVLDITRPPTLNEIASLRIANGWIVDMVLRDPYLYLVTNEGLYVIDVSNPAQPLVVSYTGGTPIPPPQPSPTPLSQGCERFGALSSRLDTAIHQPPVPDPPLSDPGQPRPFAYAVHTLFLDETAARLAAEAGFDTVVQVFPWRDLNPSPDLYAWEASDYMVRMAQAQRLNLVVRLDMPPDWARATDRADGLPFDLAAYADFVSAVARRYRGRILGYVIWNEPNLAAEWSGSGVSSAERWFSYDGWRAAPVDYVGVLGVAYRRIRAADPTALVVAAGLAPTNENSPRAQDDRDFLREMLAVGAADCFDVLGIHAYGYGLDPGVERTAHDGLNLARVLDLRDILLAQGVDKPMWITELGYTVDDGAHPSVTAVQQADYLAGALTRSRREWPWVKLLTVWNLAYGRPSEDEMSGYSLIEPDLTPRPAYWRLQAVIANIPYPLPEAQLDRFFFKLDVEYPSVEELVEIADRATGSYVPEPEPVADGEMIRRMQHLARGVPIATHVTQAAARLVRTTLPDEPDVVRRYVNYGSSPRGMQALILAGKIIALLDGRYNVAVDDLKAAALPALRHRLILNFEAQAEGIVAGATIQEVVETVLSRVSGA